MIEKDLISSLIECPDRLDDVLEHISAEDFSDNTCKSVFAEMVSQGKFDIHTLTNKFRSNKDNVSVKLLVDVAGTGFGESAVEYAKIIKEESKKRKILAIAQQMKDATGSDMTAHEIAETAYEQFLSLSDGVEKNFKSAKELFIEWTERQLEMMENKKDISGLPTPWRIVNLSTDGLRDSEMVLICARPSIGKTAFALQMAEYIANTLKENVAFFSIETSELSIMNRIISQKTRINSRKLRVGSLSKDEQDLVGHYSDDIVGGKLFICDQRPMSIFKMRSQLKRMIQQGNKPRCIFVDYGQIIDPPKGGFSEQEKIGMNAISLKIIAKEMRIPIVVLCQINRTVENGEPSTYNIKGSGVWEQEADQVWMLHRPEQYLFDKCPDDMKGKCEVIFGKNRDDGTLRIVLNFEAQCTRFYE